MTRFFDLQKYLMIPLTILAVFYVFKGSFIRPDLDDVGFGILCVGLAFGFGSMSDMTQISKKEMNIFSDNRQFRRIVIFYLILGIVMLATTVVFLIQRWLRNDEMGRQYHMLGLNCFPIVLAVFFTLKQTMDKKHYFELMNKTAG